MPFWEGVQRCEHCAHWKPSDPSDEHGYCTGDHVTKRPFWAIPTIISTKWDEGTACPVYRHQREKPHPLDRAPTVLLGAEVGDRLPVRTYRRGDIDRASAEVIHRNRHFLVVRMLNGSYRMRLNFTEHFYAGTIIELEDWGLDMEREIERVAARKEHPERAVALLQGLRIGSIIPLVGYPPFAHLRKTAKVLGISDKYITIRIDRHRRKSKMHASGPLAGIIEGEVWTLDTTEERP